MLSDAFAHDTAIHKRVLDKQKCDKIKLALKKLIVNLDEKKRGTVKADVFYKLCKLHNIRLDPQAF